MKKGLLLFNLIMYCLSAQAQWSFTTTTTPYSGLLNPVSINNGTIWNGASDFQLSLPFAFNLAGQSYSIINVKAGGGLNFPGLGTKELFVFHTPFGGYWLKDRGTTSSLSAISYEKTGTVGQRIVKIQWDNAGFRPAQPGSITNDFVNFQIWLFEADNHIEVHFGPHNTSPATYGNPAGQTGQNQGPSVKFLFDNCNNTLGLNGPANLPSYTFFNGCNPNYVFIQGSPSSGTTYNFFPTVTGISEIAESDFQIFPNPVSEYLKITGLSDKRAIKNVTVTNLAGQVVYKETKSFKTGNTLEIPFYGVSKGVYFMRIETESGQMLIRKIVKSKL